MKNIALHSMKFHKRNGLDVTASINVIIAG